jgi:thiol-disulfide isomerase/thioredoxin
MRRYLMIVLALVLGAAIVSGCGLAGDGTQSGAQEGQRLPDAEFTRLDGSKVRVSDLRGKPAVINFWATWCGPCKEEIPLLQKAYGADGGAGFQLIAVTDEARGAVSSWVEDNSMRLPVALDPGGQASQRYRIQGIPTTFFLNSEGMVVIRHIGALTPGTLKVFLEQIAGESPSPTRAPAQPAPTGAPARPTTAPAPPSPGDDTVGRRRPDRF